MYYVLIAVHHTVVLGFAGLSREPKGTTSKIYDILTVTVEIILFFCKIFVYLIYSVYELIVPPKEKSVAGEIVLITGTGHGIGKELAKQYGELGAEVICVDINTENNETTVSELKKLGIKAHAYTCDVCSRENVLKLGELVKTEVGDVSILVNNAGIMPCKKFLSHTPQEIKKMFDVNVFAHFWMLEAFLPTMMKNDKGHIVAISSMAGLVGSPYLAPYTATKFAVRGFMESLSEEFRTQIQQNIKFTTIYPYITDTGLCKNPRIKFENAMKMLTPAQTASVVVRAQRRGYKESTVPEYMFITNNIARAMPWRCTKSLIDFMDARLDEHF